MFYSIACKRQGKSFMMAARRRKSENAEIEDAAGSKRSKAVDVISGGLPDTPPQAPLIAIPQTALGSPNLFNRERFAASGGVCDHSAGNVTLE
jgi:hypothetical protein